MVLRIYWFNDGHETLNDPWDIWEYSGFPPFWMIRSFVRRWFDGYGYKLRLERSQWPN